MSETIGTIECQHLVCKICKDKTVPIVNLNGILYELCYPCFTKITKDYPSKITITDMYQILEPYRADRIMEDKKSTDSKIE